MTAHPTPNATPASSITFINVFEIDTDHAEAFITRWSERAALMSTKPGFRDSRLHRARLSDTRFQLINVSHWDTREGWDAASARDDRTTPVTSSTGLYDVVVEFSPQR
ncbi:antibiotic biosynthesis monooxygenase family protein [Nocardia sp. NPDC052001]|uniref:antibiotic biosynthesis monooxygenase family protein n=1 Tax=Nocardia sp. NPDC052001 TaxID=3154853 RepID=UPI0034121DA1